jgi:hypothetical protein
MNRMVESALIAAARSQGTSMNPMVESALIAVIGTVIVAIAGIWGAQRGAKTGAEAALKAAEATAKQLTTTQ